MEAQHATPRVLDCRLAVISCSDSGLLGDLNTPSTSRLQQQNNSHCLKYLVIGHVLAEK